MTSSQKTTSIVTFPSTSATTIDIRDWLISLIIERPSFRRAIYYDILPDVTLEWREDIVPVIMAIQKCTWTGKQLRSKTETELTDDLMRWGYPEFGPRHVWQGVRNIFRKNVVWRIMRGVENDEEAIVEQPM